MLELNRLGFARCRGFSLFELAVVIVVIGILVYSGVRYYLSTIENTKHSLIRFQAATFSRMVNNLYGQGKVLGVSEIELLRATVYLNDLGWPASSDNKTSLKSFNQSPQECEKLWHALFDNAPSTVIAGSEVGSAKEKIRAAKKDFRIFSINGRICRYELLRKQEGRYFFDYDLSTGGVTVSSPESH